MDVFARIDSTAVRLFLFCLAAAVLCWLFVRWTRRHPGLRRIVVGVTGHKASGKDVVADRLKIYGFRAYRTRDAIVAEAASRGNSDPTVEQMQDIGNEVRLATGDAGCWMYRLIEMADNDGAPRIVLNGLRHPGEVQCLASELGNCFVLIGVTAPQEIRERRYLARRQRGDTHGLSEAEEIELFRALDLRDRGIGEPEHGQRVDDTMALVAPENLIVNDGSLEEFEAKVDAVISRFLEGITKRQ